MGHKLTMFALVGVIIVVAAVIRTELSFFMWRQVNRWIRLRKSKAGRQSNGEEE